MSSSGKGKKPTILVLRELHLTPLYIYMVQDEEQLADATYTLEMYKDGEKLSETSQITFIEPTELIRYPALQFNSIRFMFNVKSLFEGEGSIKLTLKLTATSGDLFVDLEEFDVHILSYAYENSRERFVTHKENSIGRLHKSILHYSFSAIYDKYKENVQQYLTLQPQVKEQSQENQSSGFGIVITEAKRKEEQPQNLVIVEKIDESGQGMLGVNNRSGNSQELEPSFLEQPSSIKQMLHQRQAPRSMIFMEDPLSLSSMNSTMTEPDIAIQIKQQSSTFIAWLMIVVSIVLVYYLMHPTKKV